MSSKVEPPVHKESELALQVLLDRGLKRIISNLAKKKKQQQPARIISHRDITVIESNSIRYMAGYVAVKLLKKFKRQSKNDKLHVKHKLFVCTLNKMKAANQPGEPDSILEYSTLWMELVDRGGLYHINDDVFRLLQ